MAQQVVFEATQDVVSGNQVVHAAGELYPSLDKVPEGVPVRPVLADVPDKGEPDPSPPPAMAAPKAEAAPSKPVAKGKSGP